MVQLESNQFLVPCWSKLLRKTDRKGERAVFFSWGREPFFRLFYSVECTPALHFLWAFQIEEVEIKCRMPSSRRYILEKKFIALMGSLINREKYDDHTH